MAIPGLQVCVASMGSTPCTVTISAANSFLLAGKTTVDCVKSPRATECTPGFSRTTSGVHQACTREGFASYSYRGVSRETSMRRDYPDTKKRGG
ncbi:hypothetical protein ACNPM4_01765, partial [Microbacterium sp. AGC62]